MKIYQPREDSLMLAFHVKKYAKGLVLDVGTGSGIQAKTAAQKATVAKVFAVDVSKKAVSYCRRNIKIRKIVFIVSDLFNVFKKSRKYKNIRFDAIIFNPPYLPADHMRRDVSVIGGKKGYETLERFLDEVNNYLKPDGNVLVTFSSLTNKNKVNDAILKNLLTSKLLHSTRLFFEELYVYLLKKSLTLKKLEDLGICKLKYFSKGKRGVVFTGVYKGRKVAIKMKRAESEAKGRIENEADFLKSVNKNIIGPKFIFFKDGFLVYEFVEGAFIRDWLPKARKGAVKKVLRNALQQCFVLDQLKINKEEMHNPYKHIIIGKKVTILDFEKAHYVNEPKNVTQFLQFIMSHEKLLKKKRIKIDKKKIIAQAKIYKANPTKENFNKLIRLV